MPTSPAPAQPPASAGVAARMPTPVRVATIAMAVLAAITSLASRTTSDWIPPLRRGRPSA